MWEFFVIGLLMWFVAGIYLFMTEKYRASRCHLVFLALIPLGIIAIAFGFGIYVGGLTIAFMLGFLCGIVFLMSISI